MPLFCTFSKRNNYDIIRIAKGRLTTACLLCAMGDSMRYDLKLTPEYVKAIELVLARDERVMLIPTKDRIKVVRVRNEEVKVNAKTDYMTKY